MSKKIAVVTGASKGIGKSVAQYLADAGYHVVLIARNAELLQQVNDSIISNGGACSYYAIDVSHAVDVETCMQNIVTQHGHIDLVFNNAAILKKGTAEVSVADIDELLRINLNGAIYVAKYAAAHMKQQGDGYIINLSSIGGKVAQSFSGIYSASKFGLLGFSEALSKEMSFYNVKVTSICPSMVATDMTAGRKFKSEDMIRPEDINKTVGYLLSLSNNAMPLEIVIHCVPFVKQIAEVTYSQIYGPSS